MKNTTNYITLKLIFTVVFLVTIQCFSALGITTDFSYNLPYSRYGIGEIQSPLMTQNKALGGLSVAVRDIGNYHSINVGNPAQYSSIHLTCFETGFSYIAVQNSNNNQKENSNCGQINYFSIAVPTYKNSALSFGLMPYSSMDYSSLESSLIANESVNKTSFGTGMLSRVYLGWGTKIIPNWSIGFNSNYLFGTLQQVETMEYQNNNFLSTKLNNKLKINGLQLDFGTQYHKEFNQYALILGYTLSRQSNLNSDNTITLSRWYQQTESIPGDSSLVNTQSTKIQLPNVHKIGISIQKGKQFLIGTEFNYAQWSSYGEGLKDSYGAGLGGQFIPNFESKNYFNKIELRAGVKYEKTYIQILGNDIQQFTYALGFGFPLSINRNAFSKLNFTIEYKRLGTTANNLILQEMLNFNFGFTLNEKWFIKSQFD